jgi:tetratricopeptide (TPR) repeat protein
MNFRVFTFLVGMLAIALVSHLAKAQELHELALDEWKKLREVERYQLQIAEKYWQQQDWKTAADEYNKFIELYESSNGAPYAQLRWGLAQVKLRQQNTAIKEGFQTVIDYWPDSPQAIAAAFYIGRTQREIGRLKEAKSSLTSVVTKYPDHIAAVQALNELINIANVEQDVAAKLLLWKRLTFDIPRTNQTAGVCVQASQQLASHLFREGAFAEGLKALATTYPANEMPNQVAQFVRSPVNDLSAQNETKAKGNKLAGDAIVWLKQQIPADLTGPEAKPLSRQCLLSIADLTALARRDDDVPTAYEAVLKNASPDDEALGRLAAWFKSKQQYDQARTVYRRFDNKAEGLNQIAYSYREQQNWVSAIEAYNQLLAQDPQNSPRWKPELASTYRSAGQWAEAIAVYEQLVQEDAAQSGRWRFEVGCTHRDAGQFKEAIGHFRQCDNFPENYKQMAWCHRRLQQPKEAIALYNQVASDQGSAPWALLQIAYTREEAGEKEPAIQAFQLVCKRFPKDGHASQAHSHLQQKYKISITLGGATDE